MALFITTKGEITAQFILEMQHIANAVFREWKMLVFDDESANK